MSAVAVLSVAVAGCLVIGDFPSLSSANVHHVTAATQAVTRTTTVTSPAPQRTVTARAAYAFEIENADGTPARWNPCVAHSIVVNLHGAPANALADLRTAVANVDAASGLRFVITGRTSAVPTTMYGIQAVVGKAGQWQPVLVAWGPPGTGVLGTGGEDGETAPVWIQNDHSQQVFVSAEVVFSTKASGYTPGFVAGTLSRGALYEHELGHVVGLDHVRDSHEVMYPEIGYATGYGRVDNAGLRRLGAGGCLQVPGNTP